MKTWAAGATLFGALAWAACAKPFTASPGKLDTTVPTSGANYSQATSQPLASRPFSVRVLEPQCAEVPMEDRREHKCWCTWGSRCVCRGEITTESTGCVVSIGIERMEGEPRSSLRDGGVVRPIGVFTHEHEMFEVARLSRGETVDVCKTQVTCPP